MPTESIEWISKPNLLASLTTQINHLLSKRGEYRDDKEWDKGRIYQLQQIIEEIERT